MLGKLLLPTITAVLVTACLLGVTAGQQCQRTWAEGPTGVPSSFYPFGDDNDTVLARGDDSYELVYLSVPLPHCNQVYSTLRVYINGYVSFGTGHFGGHRPRRFPISTSTPAIAVYWADVNTRYRGAIHYTQTTDDEVLCRCSLDASQSVSDNFTATWAFIATWHDVTYYGGSNTTNTNTFQLVLCTDGTTTVALFNYGNITWTSGTADSGSPSTGLGGIPAQVGLSGGFNNYYSVPLSMTSQIVTIDTSTGNTGQQGFWAFDFSCWVRSDIVSCDPTSTVCLNGGTCYIVPGQDDDTTGTTASSTNTNSTTDTISCHCPTRYSGNRCEIDLDPCASSPCQNGAHYCHRTYYSSSRPYHCHCRHPYTGPVCEMLRDPCTYYYRTCYNGGNCTVVNATDFECECPEGYGGKRCRHDIDGCIAWCRNASVPQIIRGDHFNYRRLPVQCTQDVDTCVENCRNVSDPSIRQDISGEDENLQTLCQESTCANGGKCYYEEGIPVCDCLQGFQGSDCSIDTVCVPNPCKNGGGCSVERGTAICSCPSNTRGQYCEASATADQGWKKYVIGFSVVGAVLLIPLLAFVVYKCLLKHNRWCQDRRLEQEKAESIAASDVALFANTRAYSGEWGNTIKIGDMKKPDEP